MKPITTGTLTKLLFLSALTSLTACTIGVVSDSSSKGLAGVDVIAYADCGGEGCDANEVQIATPTGTLTGYQASTVRSGQFLSSLSLRE